MKKVKPIGKESEKGMSEYDWLCDAMRDYKRGLMDAMQFADTVIKQFESQRKIHCALLCRDCKEGHGVSFTGIHEQQILLTRNKNGEFKYQPSRTECPAKLIHQWYLNRLHG